MLLYMYTWLKWYLVISLFTNKHKENVFIYILIRVYPHTHTNDIIETISTASNQTCLMFVFVLYHKHTHILKFILKSEKCFVAYCSYIKM